MRVKEGNIQPLDVVFGVGAKQKKLIGNEILGETIKEIVSSLRSAGNDKAVLYNELERRKISKQIVTKYLSRRKQHINNSKQSKRVIKLAPRFIEYDRDTKTYESMAFDGVMYWINKRLVVIRQAYFRSKSIKTNSLKKASGDNKTKAASEEDKNNTVVNMGATSNYNKNNNDSKKPTPDVVAIVTEEDKNNTVVNMGTTSNYNKNNNDSKKPPPNVVAIVTEETKRLIYRDSTKTKSKSIKTNSLKKASGDIKTKAASAEDKNNTVVNRGATSNYNKNNNDSKKPTPPTPDVVAIVTEETQPYEFFIDHDLTTTSTTSTTSTAAEANNGIALKLNDKTKQPFAGCLSGMTKENEDNTPDVDVDDRTDDRGKKCEDKKTEVINMVDSDCDNEDNSCILADEKVAAYGRITKSKAVDCAIQQRLRDAHPFLADKKDDETLTVYPFEGEKDKIEEAASNFDELSYNGTYDSKDTRDKMIRGRMSRVETIRVQEYAKLEPGEWLNDALVDFWMEWMSRDKPNDVLFLTAHFQSTLMKDGVTGVKSWMDKRKINIFEKKLIFIPSCRSDHWSLCVVVNPGAVESSGCIFLDDVEDDEEDPPLSCLLFFDSLNMHNKHVSRRPIEKWLNSEWHRVYGKSGTSRTPFTGNNFKVYQPRVPFQRNGCDCGVFVCRYALAMFKLRHLKFTKKLAGIEKGNHAPFSELITNGAEFQFDLLDIERIRNEYQTFIKKLHRVYKKSCDEKKLETKRRKRRKCRRREGE